MFARNFSCVNLVERSLVTPKEHNGTGFKSDTLMSSYLFKISIIQTPVPRAFRSIHQNLILVTINLIHFALRNLNLPKTNQYAIKKFIEITLQSTTRNSTKKTKYTAANVKRYFVKKSI